MPGSKFIHPKTCENCGDQFNAKTVYSKFCSKKCLEAATSKKKEQEKQEEQRQQLVEQIPTHRYHISIAEAVVLFGISRDTRKLPGSISVGPGAGRNGCQWLKFWY